MVLTLVADPTRAQKPDLMLITSQMRQLQLLERQDQSVRMRANEMRSVAQAAQIANTNVGLAGPSALAPKQIGFRDDWATVD